MRKSNNSFYTWLKERTTIAPSRDLDKKILTGAREVLSSETPSYFKWKFAGFALVASFALLFVINNRINSTKELNNIIMSDSLEMILNYNTIELMAESSALSEEDWIKIVGN